MCISTALQVYKMILLLFVSLSALSLVHAQSLVQSEIYSANAASTLGSQGCLVSRIDTIPCRFISLRRTQTPRKNEFGVYWTRYKPIGDFINCQILSKDHYVEPILTIGSANRVLTFSSPGYLNNMTYPDNLYVDYNIQCGGGRLAFVQLHDVDLEPNNCDGRCRDYVTSIGPSGSPETCGNDTSVNFNNVMRSSLKMIFRSSPTGRYPGFAACVVCYEPVVLDEATCSPDDSETAETTERRKQFNNDLQYRIKQMQWRRKKRAVESEEEGRVEGLTFRFRSIKISLGDEVIYYRRRLDISKKTTIYFINTLFVYHSGGALMEYVTSAYKFGIPLQFFGPGELLIVGRRAYYRIYVPKDFALSEGAQRVLVNLTTPQLAMARQVAERQPTPVFPDDLGDEPIMQQAGTGTRPMFHDDDVLLALTHEDSCNPVLRASARSIIEYIEEQDPNRLNDLRRPTATPSASGPSEENILAYLQMMSPSIGRG